MKRAALLVLLWPWLAAAADRVPPSLSVEGVTKDGRYLVMSGGWGFDEMGPATIVQDLLSGTRLVFGSPEEDGTARADAWRARHPVVPLEPGRASPDKKALADVVPTATEGGGTWAGDRWVNGADVTWTFVVTRGAEKQVVGRAGAADTLVVYWTPDGKHTIWVAHTGGGNMRDPGEDDVIVGTDGSPGVSLALDKARLGDAEKVSQALARAGFGVVAVSPAAKARAQSVVYAGAGHEAEAKKLAAAVPGGAQVAPLDWKSPYDLVLALGPGAWK